MDTVEGFAVVDEANVEFLPVLWFILRLVFSPRRKINRSQSEPQHRYSPAFSAIHLRFAMWSRMPLPLRKPACISASSRSMMFSRRFWMVFSSILPACGINAIARQLAQSLRSPFFAIDVNTDLFHSFSHEHYLQILRHRVVSTALGADFRSSAGIASIPGALLLGSCRIAHSISLSRTSGSSST